MACQRLLQRAEICTWFADSGVTASSSGPGVWTCVEDGEYRGPQGRIQITAGRILTRGKSYMGLDLVAILEREFQTQVYLQQQQNLQQQRSG